MNDERVMSLVQVAFRLLLAMDLCLSFANRDMWGKEKGFETWGVLLGAP